LSNSQPRSLKSIELKGVDLRPLEIATEIYYWKPMAALFRSLELRSYRDMGVVLRGPILDLGCGDGQVACMLEDLNIIEKPLCGIEISAVELKKARETRSNINLVQADANRLPFRNESFSGITCNGVLCSIPEGVDQPLQEAYRVLQKTGVLVATIPTNKFVEVLLLPKVLRRISKTLSSFYIKRINARLPHFHIYSPEQWREKFESHGFIVQQVACFFSQRAGFVWSVLSMQMFRVLGFLKFLKSRMIRDFTSGALKRTLKRIYVKEATQAAEYGYVLIIAHKREVSEDTTLRQT